MSSMDSISRPHHFRGSVSWSMRGGENATKVVDQMRWIEICATRILATNRKAGARKSDLLSQTPVITVPIPEVQAISCANGRHRRKQMYRRALRVMAVVAITNEVIDK
jgi:hypothetical protein